MVCTCDSCISLKISSICASYSQVLRVWKCDGTLHEARDKHQPANYIVAIKACRSKIIRIMCFPAGLLLYSAWCCKFA